MPNPTDKPREDQKNSDLKAKFLEYYSKLPVQKLAADFIHRDENTISLWKKQDKKFRDDVASTKSQWALDKANAVKNPEWLLERILKEHFAQRTELEIGTEDRLEEALNRIAKILPTSK